MKVLVEVGNNGRGSRAEHRGSRKGVRWDCEHFDNVEDAVRFCIKRIESDEDLLHPFCLQIDGEEVMDANRINWIWSRVMELDPDWEHLDKLEWKKMKDGSAVFYFVNGRMRNIETGCPILELWKGEDET